MRKMTVGELMTTEVLTMRPEETVARAQFEMHLSRFRHLPIVDDRDHVIGMVSNRDLIGPLALGERQVPLGEVMTRVPRTVRPETPADEAVAMLIDHKIGALPVAGPDGRLVGIISETDFLVLASQALRGEKLHARRGY
jgi:CBS domain-containing protein